MRRHQHRFGLIASCALFIVVAGMVVVAVTESNWVPQSYADDQTVAVDGDDLVPPECAGLLLTSTITGSGSFSGTALGDYMIGSEGPDTIEGLLSSDCIVGGGGDDRLVGGLLGNDVCIGGPGTDTFSGCETQIQ